MHHAKKCVEIFINIQKINGMEKQKLGPSRECGQRLEAEMP